MLHKGIDEMSEGYLTFITNLFGNLISMGLIQLLYRARNVTHKHLSMAKVIYRIGIWSIHWIYSLYSIFTHGYTRFVLILNLCKEAFWLTVPLHNKVMTTWPDSCPMLSATFFTYMQCMINKCLKIGTCLLFNVMD